MLEGESYMTGSLTPFAINKIRCEYKEVIENDSTNESVKYLANILLKDLDERYHPTECGKVQYFRKPDTGFRNRYISLHPYMFFAAFLDPRTKVKLTSMMTNDNYKDLLGDILDNMISINEQISNYSNDGNNDYHERINESASDRGSTTKKRKQSPSVFDFLILAMTEMLPCMNCGKPVRQNSTHLKIGMLQFHSEMQVENLMILLAGGSLKEHFDSPI